MHALHETLNKYSRNSVINTLCAALAAPAFLTGCATVRYQWTSENGRLCFNQCKRDFYACRQSCLGDGWCRIACVGNEQQCDDGCPNLQRVVVGS